MEMLQYCEDNKVDNNDTIQKIEKNIKEVDK